jgi:hypothetical protein
MTTTSSKARREYEELKSSKGYDGLKSPKRWYDELKNSKGADELKNSRLDLALRGARKERRMGIRMTSLWGSMTREGD